MGVECIHPTSSTGVVRGVLRTGVHNTIVHSKETASPKVRKFPGSFIRRFVNPKKGPAVRTKWFEGPGCDSEILKC